jgi:hypothetical protein
MFERRDTTDQENSQRGRGLEDPATLYLPSARALILSGDSVSGIATFFADESGSIKKIEISHERAIFSVELPGPLSTQFKLPSSPDIPVLTQIGAQLETLEKVAVLQGLKPPQYSRIHLDPPLSELRKLEAGGGIQFTRDVQPANLQEWLAGQTRYDCSAVRSDAAGCKVAKLSTSALFLPSGALSVQVTMERFSLEKFVVAVKSHTLVARSPRALKIALEDQERLYERFEVDSIDALFSTPAPGGHNVLFREQQCGFSYLSPEDAEVPDWRGEVATPTVGSVLLHSSGAVVSWDYEDPCPKISLFRCKEDSSPTIVFSTKPATREIGLLNKFLVTFRDKPVDDAVRLAKELRSDKFQLMASNIPPHESTSLKGLFEELQCHLESEGLRYAPLEAHSFTTRQKIECVLEGFALVGFELEDLSLRRRLSSRLIVELWEGGCRTLILQTGSNEETTVDLSREGAGPRGVVELRDFLKDQLSLFREDPILLLKSHLNSPARLSPVLSVPCTPRFLDRARFLSQLMDADMRAYGRVFDQSSFAKVVVKLGDAWRKGPAYLILEEFPTCGLELEWGSAGIDRITLLSPNAFIRLMPRWFPRRALSSVAIPEEMRTDPQQTHTFLSSLLSALARLSETSRPLRPKGRFLRDFLREFTGTRAS